MNTIQFIINVVTRPKASGSSSRFQGGGVTGKGQDRDKTGTRQGQNKLKIGVSEA